MADRPPVHEEPPWHRLDAYDYTDSLPKRAWAWEFLRRDPLYQREWTGIGPAVSVEHQPHVTVLIANRPLDDLARWACFFADPPEYDATMATVFWRPEACAHVLPVTAVAGKSTAKFSLSTLHHSTTLLVLSDGSQHLVAHDQGRSLQLAVDGSSLLEPVNLRTEALFEGRHLRARLQALEGLNALVNGQRLPDQLFPVDPRSRRLRHVLQALDGFLAGATYREIAVALFGEARVLADWSDARRHLFDHVRRAVQRGSYLMKGGYRSLLL